MKNRLFTLGLAALLSFSANADDHLEKLHKDTLIMQNIMTTSLKQDARKGGIRFRKIETGYLVGQGLVFDVYTSSSGSMHFNFDFSDMIHGIEQLTESFEIIETDGSSNVVVVPDAPPAPDVPGGFSFSFDFNEEAEEYAEHAREYAREMHRHNRERYRELREKERDLNWEKREYERNIRDLEFEMRHADDDRKAELKKELADVRKSLEGMEAKREEFEKLAQKLEDEEKARKNKEQEAKLLQVKRFLADFEATIAETLCDYGSGLKSLPDTEKVNFVLKDFARGEKHRSKEKLDKVYVFNLSDVRQCVREKLTANELLMKTETYVF